VSALATQTPAAQNGDNAASVDIPGVDGFRASKLTVRFVGVIDLDKTSTDDVDFVNALRLGGAVRVICTGAVSGKGFTHRVSSKEEHEDEVGYYCSVRIDGLEIGEPA
jgi:hypothetical protein